MTDTREQNLHIGMYFASLKSAPMLVNEYEHDLPQLEHAMSVFVKEKQRHFKKALRAHQTAICSKQG